MNALYPPPTSGQDSAPESSKYLSYALTPTLAGLLPTPELVEAVRWGMIDILPMPEMHPSVMGVCHWRSQVLWVVDLIYLLTLEPLQSASRDINTACMIVVKHQHQVLGLVVPRVGQLMECDRRQFKPPSELSVPAALAPYIKQGYCHANQQISWVLDCQTILATLQG